MKKLFLLLFIFVSTTITYCQTSLKEADACFDKGDYVCAQIKYKKAYDLAREEEKQLIEIKLGQAKWCLEHINIANQAFENKNYKLAKENYQSVLETNPKDSYAKVQLEKCDYFLNQVTLSVSREKLSFPSSGGYVDINVYTSADHYSIDKLPTWCTIKKYADHFTITCEKNFSNTSRNDYFTISVENKVIRIYINQFGATKQEGTSKQSILFNWTGGLDTVEVITNSGDYSISFLPAWCSVTKYPNYFVVSCNVNYGIHGRNDWFKVTTKNKEEKIYITQLGAPKSSNTYLLNKQNKIKGTFNYPKNEYLWGLIVGYSKKYIDYYSDYCDGIQLGLKIEPLFKYGFGLNTGIILEGYSGNNSFDPQNNKSKCYKYGLFIPLHLEYRLNFSKWFNIFVYGGPVFNIDTNSSFNDCSFPVSLEYGGGMRFNHIQFNIGRSSFIGNVNNRSDFGKNIYLYQKVIFSTSYMF